VLALQKGLNTSQRNKNKMTEKQYAPTKKEKKLIKKSVETPVKKEEIKRETKEFNKNKEKKEEKKSEKETEKKVKPKEEKKKRKTIAIVNAYNIPISTKHSAAVCRFIKGKKIRDAISDLEQVVTLKKSVPMKGEIPHRKGKGLMSGRFPKKASERFIKLLKSASTNAIHNEIENPIITEAVSNIGARPWGKFGQVRKKRTHIKIVVKSKSEKQEDKTKNKK